MSVSNEAQIKAEIDAIYKRIKTIVKNLDSLDPGKTEDPPGAKAENNGPSNSEESNA